jgi:RNA polymerase sigma-70 factor (ECF subfamily)
VESPLSDDELIGRVKRGDRQAFEALVRRYQDVAFRTAWIIMRDTQDAEDVAQAAFLKAWLAIDRFHTGFPFRPWLLRIVANEAKNRQQSRQRHLRHTMAGTSPEESPAQNASPEQNVIDDEQVRALIVHINDLSEQDRTVIYCRYALELSEAEIASVLACARGTVKSRLHRALARLRDRMEALT